MKQVESILNEIAQESGFDNWEQYFNCFQTTEPGRRVINKGIRKAVTKALFLSVAGRYVSLRNWNTEKNKYMLELLKEQLQDYLEQKKAIEAECIQLMKEGKEWKELAKKGAGLKMMIEAILLEIKRWS